MNWIYLLLSVAHAQTPDIPKSRLDLLLSDPNQVFFSFGNLCREHGVNHLLWSTTKGTRIVYGKNAIGSELETYVVSGQIPSIGPQLACSGAGLYYAAFNGNGGDAYFSRSNGNAWEEPRIIVKGGQTIKITTSGKRIYALVSTTYYRVDIYVSEDAGETWQKLIKNVAPPRGAGYPDITMEGDTLHLTGHSDDHSIWYRKAEKNAQGKWELRPFVTIYSAQGQQPRIRVMNGLLHILWVDYETTPYSWTGNLLYARSADHGSTWNVKTLTQNNRVFAGGTYAFGIDPEIPTRISIAWMDDRRFPPNEVQNSDIYLLNSSDGGKSWDPEIDLTSIYFKHNRLTGLDLYSSGGEVGVFFDEVNPPSVGGWKLWRIRRRPFH